MNVREEDELPAGRTPRKLFKLSGEKFFNIIMVRALPALELFLAEDECYKPLYFPARSHIMEYLRELKNYFELDTIPLLGPKDSPLRLSLEEVFPSVLDDHCEVMEGPRDQQLVAIFMFQIFFLKKAGKIATTNLYGADHLAPRLQEFMRRMGPSEVTAFYSNKIYFDIPKNLAFFFQYMPYLQSIHLQTCYDEYVLESMRKYCQCLEKLFLEIKGCEDLKDIEQSLCEAFFCGSSLSQMLSKQRDNEAVDLSFPRLRQVTIHSETQYDITVPYHFIFLLQQFYLNTKVKWYFGIGEEETLDSVVESGILCPSFIKDHKDVLYFDVLAIYADPRYIEQEETTYITPHTPMFLKANCINFNDWQENLANIPHAIKELMRKHHCRNLQHSFTPDTCWRLSEIFNEIGENLSELYLEGTCLRTLDGVQLSAALVQCVNLNVLSLELDLKFSPMLNLGTFTKLKVLSFKIIDFVFWAFNSNERALTEGRYSGRVAAYMDLNFVNHNLPLYLHCNDLPPSLFYRYIHRAWESNGNCMPTLRDMPAFPVSRNLKKFAFWPMISSIFGYGTLKYDIPSSHSSVLGYGVVEWNGLEWELNASSCHYRNPRFVFLGNPKYGFQLLPEKSHSLANIDTLRNNPISSIDNTADGDSSARDIKIDHGSYLYKKLYRHLKRSTKITLSQNHKSQELENNLRQWRPDMDFSAPFNILFSLLKASPNLKVLEIPDLRITDQFVIFCNKDILKNLSKVHTLHLSAQFSTPLIYSIVNMDLLKTVRVDPEYGLDNYLRFKRGLSKTNLEVQFGHSFVYPSSEYLRNI